MYLSRKSIGLTLATAASLILGATCFDHLSENSFGIPGRPATYDYVVVGGGTSGNTIAARLAEDPSVSVAVIEAGSFYQISNGNGSVIPYLTVTQNISTIPTDTQPLIDWGFVTQQSQGLGNRSVHYARGKCLGGSGCRSFMLYSRPSIGAMQTWADEVGDQSYTFDKVLPYFKKSVQLTPPNNKKRTPNGTVHFDPSAFSNKGGPLRVSWPNFVIPFLSWAPKALKKLGIPVLTENFASGELLGGAWCPSTIDGNKFEKDSSQTSFLAEAQKKTSITIYIQSLVKRILFSADKTATGVQVQTGGVSYTINARKEVIVSAGAFQSPQLLMVSGIGPRETLTKNNIPVVKNLPGVGQNLRDQPLYQISYPVSVTTSSKLQYDPEYAAQVDEEYRTKREGTLTATPSYLAFEKLPDSSRKLLSNATLDELEKFPKDWPEVEYIFSDQNFAAPVDGKNYAGIEVGVMATTSKGFVDISSGDMADPPVIHPALLETDADAEVMVAGFKRARELWQSLPIRAGPELFPGEAVQTDEQILQSLRSRSFPLFHASATCKMGRRSDHMSVVDTKGRVHGINGLRVVDLSIIPFLPAGHPQSIAYMLAEKIACNIKHSC